MAKKEFITNTAELARVVARKHELHNAQSQQIILSAFEAIGESLNSQAKAGVDLPRVSIQGFGNFKISRMKARQGRNPRTGDPTQIKAQNRVTFAPAKSLKGTVNPSAE